MTTETTTEAKTEKTAAKVGSAAPSDDKNNDRRSRGTGRRAGGGRRRQKREPKEFEESILEISRVTRVVKGGRRMRFKVCVVIGDKKGRVALGTGKSTEVVTSIQKAVAQAKKRMIKVPIFNGTLPHHAVSKYKASKVLLFPAPAGKGIIAGGAVRKIMELAGYKDVLSKVHGSRNKLNVANATLKALAEMQVVAPKKQKKEVVVDESPEIVSPDIKEVESAAPKKIVAQKVAPKKATEPKK